MSKRLSFSVLYHPRHLSPPALRRMYQKQTSNEVSVASGEANPIQKSNVGSTRLNSHDRGMRNRKVAIRLCIIGKSELSCPLK